RVPPVLALYPRDDLALPARLERVQAGEGSRPRVGREAEARRPRRSGCAALGTAPGRLPSLALLELAPPRDDGDLPRLVVRPVGDRLERVQQRAARPRGACRLLGRLRDER